MFFTILISATVLIVAGIYFFGIPPELKRNLERKALQTMGENKMSYLAKDQISKLPTSDQENIKQFKAGIGNAIGGGLNNPLGDTAGEAADDLTKPLTGR
ncbi:hypothetical protein GQ43DRAFT_368136 [Delitschia confertaspora ATCC 74209]|uniref:Uncharacterized protein n=1 Tax=Delitschia confertaspora ATCC 74209 TaxID=1513339 RepID=A0A9P4JPL6_9PLEO|nr:hypothetical protein GQ43DRAFT_368136 [Delitschia confertaspora ATCC 74209]